jgi:quercetin 2,3-dioxygenase
MTTTTTGIRTVERVVHGVRTFEGAGFAVRRPFPTESLAIVDPFLLLDHLGPSTYGPGEAVGAPDHPHRGFETVTYVLEGAVEHKDSTGGGIIGPGDVQWMTAGGGIVHSEMPTDEIMRNGGTVHGFQLWVNLPRSDKMVQPRYQGIPLDQIPTAESEDGKARVKVIAGESMGVSAAIETRTPIMYFHFTLEPGARIEQSVPGDYNAFAYVVSGDVLTGDDAQQFHEGDAAVFAGDGDRIVLSVADAASTPADVLLIAGVPLNEPVVHYGPFVMNTKEEIYQAIKDYNEGRMGQIAR